MKSILLESNILIQTLQFADISRANQAISQYDKIWLNATVQYNIRSQFLYNKSGSVALDMNDKLFLFFGKNCHQKCKPCLFAEIQQHQKSTKLQHKGMQLNKYHQKYKKFSETINKLTEGLTKLKTTIQSQTEDIISRVRKLRVQLLESIDVQINRYYIADRSSHHLKTQMMAIEKEEFNHVTCHQLRQILKIFDTALKEPTFIETQTNNLKKIKTTIQNQFQTKLQSIIQVQQSKKLELFSASQSTIQQRSNDNSSNKFESLLGQLESQTTNQKNTKKRYKKVDSKVEKSYSGVIIESDHEDGENIYSQKAKLNPTLGLMTGGKRQSQKKQSEWLDSGREEKQSDNNSSSSCYSSFLKSLSEDNKGSQISSSVASIKRHHPKSMNNGRLDNQMSSGMNSQVQEQGEDNEDKLNQTVLMIKDQVMNREKNSSIQKSTSFYTIEQLEKHKEHMLHQSFSIKVKIIKLLYYSVLQRHIPKLKFIAGDSTGYAIFFTNYCPGMKVGTCLSLFDCTFHLHRKSLQIRNDHNFAILTHQNISVNMKGIRLNKVLTQDLQYPLVDRRCLLIRQLATKLKDEEKVSIYRMFVRVTGIIYEQGTRVFCQVGDSSGLMMAYLKTSSRLKSIREGDVVRLIRAKGCRGMEKAKKKEFGEEIIYIDCEDQKAKVLPHGFDFLEISDDVMALH